MLFLFGVIVEKKDGNSFHRAKDFVALSYMGSHTPTSNIQDLHLTQYKSWRYGKIILFLKFMTNPYWINIAVDPIVTFTYITIGQ